MGKLKEIKKRIKSVNNIAQVTNAMQLVAASRMRRAQDNAKKGRGYAERIKSIMTKLSLNKSLVINPLINQGYSDAREAILVLFSPQRGLAGALPGNLARFTHSFAEKLEREGHVVQFVTIGPKVRDLLMPYGYELLADFSDMPEQPTTGDIRPIITMLTQRYLDKQAGHIFLVYPRFVNAMTQIPTAQTLIPLDLTGMQLTEEVVETSEDDISTFTFEPSVQPQPARQLN